MPQLSKGDTFADGQQVTGVRLNGLVDNATILPGVITDQTSITANTVDNADSILLHDSSASALREATASDLLNSGLSITTGAITGNSGADLVLTPSAGQKVDVAGAIEVDSENVVGNSTIGGTLTVTGSVVLNGTTKANLTTDSTVITQTAGDNSTKPASTAFVHAQITASNYIKAFCKNSGTTINNGFNIASVTNPTAGEYVYTFTNALSDANYIVNATALISSTSQWCLVSAQSASSFTVKTSYPVSYGGAYIWSNVTSMMVSVMKA